jgi:hypothetical protein
MVPFGEYKETDNLYSGRKLYKLELGNLNTGLKVKGKMFSTELEFSRSDGRTSRLPKVRNKLDKNGSNKNNSKQGVLRHVGMVWEHSTHGG